MNDDRSLVDLINSRISDVISRMDGHKSDIIRELQGIKDKAEAHEKHDQERFGELDKLKWKAMGAFSAIMILVQIAKELLLKK